MALSPSSEVCESGGAEKTESEPCLRTSCPRPVLKPDGDVVRGPSFTGPGDGFIAHPQGSSTSLSSPCARRHTDTGRASSGKAPMCLAPSIAGALPRMIAKRRSEARGRAGERKKWRAHFSGCGWTRVREEHEPSAAAVPSKTMACFFSKVCVGVVMRAGVLSLSCHRTEPMACFPAADGTGDGPIGILPYYRLSLGFVVLSGVRQLDMVPPRKHETPPQIKPDKDPPGLHDHVQWEGQNVARQGVLPSGFSNPSPASSWRGHGRCASADSLLRRRRYGGPVGPACRAGHEHRAGGFSFFLFFSARDSFFGCVAGCRLSVWWTEG